MRTLAAAALGLCASIGTAAAGEIVIDMPGVEVSGATVAYDCDGTAFAVRYVNAGEVSLAIFEVGGETVVASAVLAASGVRYAGGLHVLWTKGDAASLYDVTAGEDADAVLECRAAS